LNFLDFAGYSRSLYGATIFMGCIAERFFRLASAVTLAILVAVAGCSDDHGAGAIASVNTNNIQKLTNLYSGFQFARYGPGPKDEAEFKRYIKNEMGPYHLGLMQIDPNNIDAVFISERDHKPFKVRYGVNGGPGVVNAIVFEADGVGGKKQVGINGGTVMEVDDAQYQEMWSGKWHPAGNGTSTPGTPGAGGQKSAAAAQ
jgi:hypothetical protein